MMILKRLANFFKILERWRSQFGTVIIFDNHVQNKPLGNQTPSLSSCDMLSWQQVFISLRRPCEESLFIRLSVKCDSSCTVSCRLKKVYIWISSWVHAQTYRFLSKTADKAYSGLDHRTRVPRSCRHMGEFIAASLLAKCFFFFPNSSRHFVFVEVYRNSNITVNVFIYSNFITNHTNIL